MKITPIRESRDNSIKYLFTTKDERNFEAIYFDFVGKYGLTKISEKVICLSSQIGCPLTCSFCETGKMKYFRNLTSKEMEEGVSLINNDIEKRELESPEYIALMGMGEPLLNLPNVKEFYRNMNESVKGISLSSSGISSGIYDLARDESTNFLLYISFHSPFNSQRNKIMPINKSYPIEDILEAGKFHAIAKEKKTILSYMALPNLNMTKNHLEELCKIINPEFFTVQLTCLNSKESKLFLTEFNEFANIFSSYMDSAGIDFDFQTSKGRDIDGGCGQMANKV